MSFAAGPFWCPAPPPPNAASMILLGFACVLMIASGLALIIAVIRGPRR